MENIIDMLSNHTVEITFTSLSSGREISANATLKEDLIPSHFNVNQSKDAESVLCYLTNEKRWEDINKKSIVAYKIVE